MAKIKREAWRRWWRQKRIGLVRSPNHSIKKFSQHQPTCIKESEADQRTGRARRNSRPPRDWKGHRRLEKAGSRRPACARDSRHCRVALRMLLRRRKTGWAAAAFLCMNQTAMQQVHLGRQQLERGSTRKHEDSALTYTCFEIERGINKS